jgi:3-oxoacyl-[acyl-carrier protein] reductase
MSDFLLELGQNRIARQLIQNLGLPIPVPNPLKRATGPMQQKPLVGRTVALGKGAGAELASTLETVLRDAGAEVRTDAPSEGQKVDALVFDATGLANPADLVGLFQFFSPWIGALAKNGRIVVVGRPAHTVQGAERAAAQAALAGFGRSIAKEISDKTATANVLFVEKGADARVAGPLRFFLSEESAYVNSQPLEVLARAETSIAPKWSKPLEGKVALVTGAARGIGEQIARQMAAEGAHVVVLDRPGEDELVNKLVAEIGGTALLADITSPDAPAKIAAALKAKNGGVDIVVHNAGITRDKTLRKMSKEFWDLAVDINLGAIVRIDQALLDGVLNKDGRIVVLSSVSGIAGNRGQTNYSAAKSGLIGYVEARSIELASRGVTVNAIAPGFIETRLTDAMPFANREVARRLNSLGQGGQPEDVAHAITFLSTPGAMGVTGNVLRVCGGMLIGA